MEWKRFSFAVIFPWHEINSKIVGLFFVFSFFEEKNNWTVNYLISLLPQKTFHFILLNIRDFKIYFEIISHLYLWFIYEYILE